MKNLIFSLHIILMWFAPLVWSQDSPKPVMKLWVHLVYPSQYMLNSLNPFVTDLSERTGINFQLAGGKDPLELAKSCKEGMPQIITSSSAIKEFLLKSCPYRVVVQAESQAYLLVKKESGIRTLVEVKRIGAVASLRAGSIARGEFADKDIQVLDYPDYFTVFSAYRAGEVDAMVLPSMFYGRGNALEGDWIALYQFKMQTGAIMLASPLVSASQFETIQRVLLENNGEIKRVWQDVFGVQPFYKPD